jgi:hypothetical protein
MPSGAQCGHGMGVTVAGLEHTSASQRADDRFRHPTVVEVHHCIGDVWIARWLLAPDDCSATLAIARVVVTSFDVRTCLPALGQVVPPLR